MFSKPKWYEMLPNSVKPINQNLIEKIDAFFKKYGAPNDFMIFMGIMTTKWAVKKIQEYTLEVVRKQMPNVPENHLWKLVILGRLDAKLHSGKESDPYSKPLSHEEISRRIKDIDNIISGFITFDDVINYVISIDEEENRFFDPTGIRAELEALLEKNLNE